MKKIFSLPFSASRTSRIAFLDLAIFFFAFISLLLYMGISRVNVNLELVSEFPENAEIFFTDGQVFTADKSVRFKIQGEGRVRSNWIELPVFSGIQKLRFDFLDRKGSVVLRSVRVNTFFGEVIYGPLDFARVLKPLHQVEISEQAEGGVKIISLGSDPYLELILPEASNYDLKLPAYGLVLLAMMLSLVIVVSLNFLLQMLFADPGEHKDWGVKVTSLAFLLLFLCIVVGKLHRSSIEMWNNYLPQQDSTSSVIFGDALPIRSDEWVVQTPWILSQWMNGSDSSSTSMGPRGTALLTAVPVNHIALVGQPKFWGGLFLPLEYAFSWLWAYKLVGLFAALFAMFYSLTRSVFYSWMGSLWIYGASFTQWWFSSNLPEIMIGFAGSVSAVVFLIRARSNVQIAAYAALLVVFALSTALHLYPPFIIPLFYFGLFLVVAAGLSSKRAQLNRYWVTKAGSLFASTLLIVLIGWLTFKDAAAAIDLVSNTVYPGQRVSVGGDFDPMRLIVSLFEFWRISGDVFPQGLVNASEASHFISVWPVVLILAVILDQKILSQPLIIAVATYCLLLSAYLFIGVSPEVSRITGFSLAPASRAFVGLGIGGIVLCVLIALHFEQSDRAFGSKPLIIAVLLLVCLVLALGGMVGQSHDPFYTTARLWASAVILPLLICAILFRQRMIFGLAIMGISLPGLIANPVAVGLSPIMHKEIFGESERLQSGTSSPKWAIFGNALISQAFVANGFKTFAGQQYVPTPEIMAVLDPDTEFEEIWNRYARIELVANNSRAASFDLVYPDHFQIKISPCSEVMVELSVTHIASSTPLGFGCLSPANIAPINGMYLYTVKIRNSAPVVF